MQPPITLNRLGSIMSLIGVVLILLGVILPLYMYQGNGTDLFYPETEWQIATQLGYPGGVSTSWPYLLLFSLPLLCAFFIGTTSAIALWRELSPLLVQMRRWAARAGFLIQFLLAVIVFLLLSFSLALSIGAGFLLMLFGFALTLSGTLPHAKPRQSLIRALLDATVFLALWLASLGVSLPGGGGLIRFGLIVSSGILVGLIHLLVPQGGQVDSHPIRNH